MIDRLKSNPFMAPMNPAPSVPSWLPTGTRTSSKNSDPRWASLPPTLS